MSEDEKRLRLNYRVVRNRWIKAQALCLIIALTVMLLSAVFAMIFNKTYYVGYTERSEVDYGVHLKENDFYKDSFLGKDYAYIAALIDKVEASFDYEVVMDSDAPIDFTYTYRVDSVVEIKDIATSKVLYAPVYNEVAEVSKTASGKGVLVEATALVDYDRYNAVAKEFIDKYKLKNVKASVTLQMVVDVTGKSDSFYAEENVDSYISSISIPLNADTLEITITSATPPEGQKILSYTTKNISDVFKVIAIVFACVAGVMAIVLWLFAYLSRNIDVTYDIKVAKLLRNYKSFIQRIRSVIDTSEYQVVLVDTFDEMLDIRDTLQSPILMQENEDKTCSRFFIPTTTRFLYLYEIKVEDYDDIYSAKEAAPEVAESPAPTVAEPAPDVTEEFPEATAAYVVEEPVEEVEEPVEENVDEIAEEPVEENVDEVVEEPAEEVVDEVAEEPVEEVVDEVVEEPAEEVVDEVAEEPAEEVVDEVAEEPAEEVVDEVAEEPVEEVVDEVAEEPTEEVVDEIAEEPAEEVREDAELAVMACAEADDVVTEDVEVVAEDVEVAPPAPQTVLHNTTEPSVELPEDRNKDALELPTEFCTPRVEDEPSDADANS